MGILLHPFVSVPISVAIDFVTDYLKKCFNCLCKNKCKTEKKYSYVNTMPLYLAFVCACQYYLVSTWDVLQKKHEKETNLTMRVAFDDYLKFNQCCEERTLDRLCYNKNKSHKSDFSNFVSEFFKGISTLVEQSSDMSNTNSTTLIDQSSDVSNINSTTLVDQSSDTSNINSNSYVCYTLIGVIILMIIYVIIENCTSNPIPISSFIIGPPNTNHRSQEAEQQFEMTAIVPTMQQKSHDDDSSHEQEDPRPSPTKNKKSKKKLLIFKIVCCFLTILYIVGVILSTNSLDNAFVDKLLECGNGLYDTNPGKLNNRGKFCESKFLQWVMHLSVHKIILQVNVQYIFSF